ncbi:MAG: hypothetical protein GY765_40720 [bacterium]|nr:hypothetical protein [bacterium]
MKKQYAVIIALVMVFFGIFMQGTGFGEEIDRSRFPRLKWMGPDKPDTYLQYMKNFPKSVLQSEPISPHYLKGTYTTNKSENNRPKVLVIVEQHIYTDLPEYISMYCLLLDKAGYNCELGIYHGSSAEGLRTYLQDRSEDLIGCVLVGNIPAAWYEVANDYLDYGYAQFPCDLFYMDLDGTWNDTDGNGIYDDHRDGTGDCRPEIFIGRIDASKMPGNELDNLRDFFNKDFRYWAGNIPLQKNGLTYTEDDWQSNTDINHGMNLLYPTDYVNIKAPETSSTDYLNNRLNSLDYEFVQLACHSSAIHHYFTREGTLGSLDIREAPPEALGYNLFCCSASRFSTENFMGGTYIFNEGQKAIVCTGSTKTGSMLDFHYFYQPLGENKPMGTALKEWFEKMYPYDEWDIYWHYGMTITGDPLVSFIQLPDMVFAPAEAKAVKGLNRSMFMREYLDLLTWTKNPLNSSRSITGYNIYRFEGSGEILVSNVDASATQYVHRGASADKRTYYTIKAVTAQGEEGVPIFLECRMETDDTK